MNILLISLAILCLWRAYQGWKNGFAEEIIRLVSLVIALLVLSLAVMAISSFMEHNTRNGVIAVLLITMIGIIFRMISVLLHSIKTIAELPVIGFFNQILGIGVGIFEVIVAVWIMYAVIAIFPTGQFEILIMKWTMENEWLTRLYQADLMIGWTADLFG